jgi:hypothetical protein
MNQWDQVLLLLVLVVVATAYAAGYRHGKVDGWLANAHPLLTIRTEEAWSWWRWVWQRRHAGLPPE